MERYLNKNDKQMILQAVAFMLHMREMGQDERFGKYKKNANMAATWAEKWVGEILGDYGEDETEEVFRMAQAVDINLTPKAVARSEMELVILPKDAVERITASALADCNLCEKEGKEVKKCRMRKDLAAVGVGARGEADCPYRIL